MSTRGMRGVTLVEVAVATVIGLGALAVLVTLLSSTDGMARESRTDSRAAAEHRRNLTALADALRGVQLTSLAGFDLDDLATAPSFRRVTGRQGRTATFGPIERLEWRPRPLRAAEGISLPGAVWLASPDGDVLLADRVPGGGFTVRQDGRTLAILLTTYYPHPTDGTRRVSGSVAVAVRN